ncbi:autotransporter outer membrane beta-barrel domain-containing protein [Candidatus Reidiella endopervernicosa]|uniref:Autotransporter outer membrane beta-barrel domain-containing protein n=1 Tax=Candidatus Reidiella endopervernicosa TaxID=2738883 RepID=A0A6N0HY15_9GAMM|nr:autotransporter outer membrane beta-barrel domain-containing protein [Candidatus Reidiella endopervernicosa]QKQ27263.1 autotransporter outer membrane beta-barrel domain-containing protein [Candidatus Reidiella endopervernicosa]
MPKTNFRKNSDSRRRSLHGFVAQSVGGGGGNGGTTVSASASLAAAGSGAVSVAVGGDAGTGGVGGNVDVTLDGQSHTRGDQSDAIVIQSVGGSGGNGGMTVSGAAAGAGAGSGAVAAGVGGSAGDGDSGGTVNAQLTVDIQTEGDGSDGAVIQSVGGSGGNAGLTISAGAAGAGVGSGSVSVGVGGSGGTGGDGNSVTADYSGDLSTSGSNATGILVQSVGGGGGNGGGSITVTLSGSGSGSGAVSVGLGGSGGAAGDGGSVNVSVNVSGVDDDGNGISTSGSNSNAFVAQSVGGGGGNGGYSITASGAAAGTGSGAVSVGLGGSGSGGGDGGEVNALDILADLSTYGDDSVAVLVQSVGGGSGGYNISGSSAFSGTGSGAVSVGLGGQGSSGGAGGDVSVVTEGTLYTEGDRSAALIAQSIGGGGGSGGYNISGSAAAAGVGSGSVSVGLGGSGGSGSSAGTVDVTTSGNIHTLGEMSVGLLAQSVGGGGGSGGYNISGSGSGAGTGSGTVSVGLGGSGGSGGDGSTVTVSVTNDVTTEGDNSGAVIAQSIGGGGGNGGYDISAGLSGAATGSGSVAVSIGGSGGTGGVGGIVDTSVTGTIATSGDNSVAVLSQSVGGGGGNGGLSVSGTISGTSTGSGSVSVGLGGSGGSGGASNSVTSTVEGSVTTQGNSASGVVAQSIGGGGGNGGMSVAGALSGASSGSGAITVGIGGSGGSGGLSGDLLSSVTGYVQTGGDDAMGVLVQSIGGGGGSGGNTVSASISAVSTGSGAVAVGIGGFGGGGGQAGAVDSTVTGGVVTSGDRASAILAQSVGGGGGAGGNSVTGAASFSKSNGGVVGVGVGIGGFGGDGGNAGSVISRVTATEARPVIATAGDDASAVVAQSIGGGGGNGGTNISGTANITGNSGASIAVGIGGFGGGGGDAGDVTLDSSGVVNTSGANSHGVMAQSLGGGGGNGGTNISGALSLSNTGTGGSAAIGIGGFGAGGGDAGSVDLDFDGTVSALARELVAESIDPETEEVIPAHYVTKAAGGSHGVVAQSIGGGGGNGAINISGGVSYSKGGDGHALVVGVGGFGGDGGSGGGVDLTVTGGETIDSFGDEHSALLAQSVGGGGGNGGINISGGMTSDAPIVFGLGGLGGLGGDGGTGGDVTLDAVADTSSWGRGSSAIVAQSIGGGGGNGALNISGSMSISKESTTPAVTVGIGGFGGIGAVSGDVLIGHEGTVVTEGDWAHGLFAQSIAGGGGNGGINVAAGGALADSANSGDTSDFTLVAGLGGHGGDGADAGLVTVVTTGAITTVGEYARGIYAQSLGGGGGTGGINISANVAQKSSPISIGVGGFGAGGGDANAVDVRRGTAESDAGLISTNGKGSIGIEASSIGGGGGDAGINLMLSATFADGSGGGAPDLDPAPDSGSTRTHPTYPGIDESVFSNFDSVIDELNRRNGHTDPDPDPDPDTPDSADKPAYAIQLAIGGAGGEAGHGERVDVDNYGNILTQADFSQGVLAQSIGGGGGNANFNLALAYADKSEENLGLNVAIGGATGDGGNGEEVTVDHVGIIETYGVGSTGILAQSIGGGGGNTGMDIAYSKQSGGKVGISIGRMGGTGGFGSDVAVSSDGTVHTFGDDAFGILAQSVGNGGGNSSSTSVSGSLPKSSDAPIHGFGVAIGLEGGVGGAAGRVDVDASGAVVTEGDGSHAVFAQSVGGGGGNGGNATGATFKSTKAALSLGGEGGEGGIGGVISIVSEAGVQTSGEAAIGILGQSIGGGGGTGGMGRAGGPQPQANSLYITMGGAGGTGASSSEVTVDNNGIVVTDGTLSHGILAQSLGGGGGIAGITANLLTATADKADSTQYSLSLAMGGDGGDGAVSGAVEVTNSGAIQTIDDQSVAIFAQSIGGGGGGGNASHVISSVRTANGTSDQNSNKIGLTIGGSGGTGAAAGRVDVSNLVEEGEENSGLIITAGDGSHGIMAMSVGGGGGNGSTTTTFSHTSGTSASAINRSLSFSMGGAGGTGGIGTDVGVINEGGIFTSGAAAHGIVAQSIGGGGGNGGSATSINTVLGAVKEQSNEIAFAIGGSGGDGNAAGSVSVDNSGSIEVTGEGSYGIFAQSVGGGGGSGAYATASSGFNQEQMLLDGAIGGWGGDGADSGDITIDHTGSIVVDGDNGYGIFAQTVSGGGGSAGIAISRSLWTAADYVLPLLLGSKDGSNGVAGSVTVNSSGTIAVTGDNSQAIFAQSVNGGGGDVELFLDLSQNAAEHGDDSVVLDPNDGFVDEVIAFITTPITLGTEWVEDAIGSAIEASHVGDLISWGENASASITQSIGGGGGSGTIELGADGDAQANVTINLGSSNSSNSGGGNVSATRTGNVYTLGDLSDGINVQSIGGGGGQVSVVANLPATTTTAAPARAKRYKAQGAAPAAAPVYNTITLGGDGSVGDHGGVIDLTYSGDVVTAGIRSPAIVLQSIGAGGGDIRSTGVEDLEVVFGATGSSVGNGGAITLVNSGVIGTEGELSHGIVLQSIGGGGGLVLTDQDEADIVYRFNSDNSGNGGDITFTQTGEINVSGDRSIAVVAQSLGGGGGMVDRLYAGSAGGSGMAGAISLDLTGNVIASGSEGVAIFAQSEANDGNGNIEITLAAESLLYAGEDGAGVWLSGGATNRVTNYGSMMTFDELAASTLLGSTGDDRIDNYGLIYGQFDLGGGANSFNNHEDAIFVSGPTLSLGGWENLMLNDGLLYIGDTGLAQPTTLSGSFTQSATGITYAELDFGTDLIDNIAMSGAADLAGEIDVRLLNPQLVPSGVFQKDIFTGEEGVTDSGMFLTTAPSMVITYEVNYPTANSAVLDYEVDFSPSGMSDNLNEVGDYFNRVQAAGSTEALADTVVNLLYTDNMETYRNTLSQMSPDFYGAQQVGLISGSQEFGQRMMSCKQTDGAYRFNREGSCSWGVVEKGEAVHSAYGDYKQIDHTSQRVAVGAQQRLENEWSVGVGFSNEGIHSKGFNGQWVSEGVSRHLGLALKRSYGPTKLAAALSYGWNSSDTERTGVVVDPFATVVERETDALGALLRLSYDFESERSYFRPQFDIGLTRVTSETANETGAGPLSLTFYEHDETLGWVRPAVDFGHEVEFNSGDRLRLSANLGAQFYIDEPTTSVWAGLEGAPDGIDPMIVAINLGDTTYHSSLSLDYLTRENYTVQLQYGMIRSDRIDARRGMIKLSLPF